MPVVNKRIETTVPGVRSSLKLADWREAARRAGENGPFSTPIQKCTALKEDLARRCWIEIKDAKVLKSPGRFGILCNAPHFGVGKVPEFGTTSLDGTYRTAAAAHAMLRLVFDLVRAIWWTPLYERLTEKRSFAVAGDELPFSDADFEASIDPPKTAVAARLALRNLFPRNPDGKHCFEVARTRLYRLEKGIHHGESLSPSKTDAARRSNEATVVLPLQLAWHLHQSFERAERNGYYDEDDGRTTSARDAHDVLVCGLPACERLGLPLCSVIDLGAFPAVRTETGACPTRWIGCEHVNKARPSSNKRARGGAAADDEEVDDGSFF